MQEDASPADAVLGPEGFTRGVVGVLLGFLLGGVIAALSPRR